MKKKKKAPARSRRAVKLVKPDQPLVVRHRAIAKRLAGQKPTLPKFAR